jgi:hypothetical protein
MLWCVLHTVVMLMAVDLLEHRSHYCAVLCCTFSHHDQLVVPTIVQQRPSIKFSTCTLQASSPEPFVIRESLCLGTIDRCSRRKESQTYFVLPQP